MSVLSIVILAMAAAIVLCGVLYGPARAFRVRAGGCCLPEIDESEDAQSELEAAQEGLAEMQDRLAETEERLVELGERRVTEVEERLDFAERVLQQQREKERQRLRSE